jgi:hypothetical protein
MPIDPIHGIAGSEHGSDFLAYKKGKEENKQRGGGRREEEAEEGSEWPPDSTDHDLTTPSNPAVATMLLS